jgi:hypothetical protein
MDTVPLIFDGGGGVLLSAGSLNPDLRAGARLAATMQLRNAMGIELEVFGINDWASTVTVSDPTATLPGFGGVAPGAAPFNVDYGSELYSAELSWRLDWGGRLTTLLGFRWINLHEDMLLTDAVSPPDLFIGDVNNNLYGLQLGVEAVVLRWMRLEIECGLKAGIYHNSADFYGAAPQAAQQVDVNDGHVAFSGDVFLGANYYLTNWLALRAGYQVMWIEGVALLPEQADNVDLAVGGDLDMGGSPIYHGGYVGVYVLW